LTRNVSGISFGESKARSTAWAVTFGDMVTLLLTFFILVIVMMNEAEKHVDRIINMLLDETYKELSLELQSQSIKVERVTKGVKITIASGQLFPSGQAELRSEVIPIVEQIALLLKTSKITRLKDDLQFKPFVQAIEKSQKKLSMEIRTEGHTDNIPLPSELMSKWESNWELSTARALNIVELLSEFSELGQDKFSAMGYGEFRPLYNNNSTEGRSQNRRVEIYIDAFVTDKIK
tara:strand:+ start:9433 stop:10134 length:702 start_codon:yes stop_codon:yes gene_type:complete